MPQKPVLIDTNVNCDVLSFQLCSRSMNYYNTLENLFNNLMARILKNYSCIVCRELLEH